MPFARDTPLPMKRHPVALAGEVPPGGRKIVSIGPFEVGVFNIGGEIRAYRNACPHAGAPVCLGRVSGTSLPSAVYEYVYGKEGCILRCPWHGWEFDLRTGEHLVDPRVRLKRIAVEPAKSEDLDRFALEQSEGTLYVLLPD
jgi:nitrite reductase/ring-hydroxylating ferredoxin subunit